MYNSKDKEMEEMEAEALDYYYDELSQYYDEEEIGELYDNDRYED